MFDLLRIKESLVKSKADKGIINVAPFKFTNLYSRDNSALGSILHIKYGLHYWSWHWSSGLLLPTDGILIARFNDINTPTSGGKPSTRGRTQLLQCSALLAWNSNFLSNYQAPFSCFLLYASVTLSQISLGYLSQCFKINNLHPGSLLAHRAPLYELEKDTHSSGRVRERWDNTNYVFL